MRNIATLNKIVCIKCARMTVRGVDVAVAARCTHNFIREWRGCSARERSRRRAGNGPN